MLPPCTGSGGARGWAVLAATAGREKACLGSAQPKASQKQPPRHAAARLCSKTALLWCASLLRHCWHE
jgi:hypothetical protein